MNHNARIMLLDIIPVGGANATTGRDLARQLQQHGALPANAKDPARIVRQIIHDLRALGVPICADSNDGFYLPSNPDELREYLARLAHRLKELAEPFHALKHTYQDWAAATAGQTSTEPEHEPLSHIPEPYRQTYLQRITTTSSPPAGRAGVGATPSPPAGRAGVGGAPSPPAGRAGVGADNKTTPTLPNIPQLIQTLLPRLPVKRNTTTEEAANWLLLELSKCLREKPYYIYLPLAYLNREGWNKGAIALHIQDWLQQRKQQRKHQQTLEVEQ